ncbi:hypothetical protein VPH35_084797 [Triticum aestivum]
MEMEADLSPCRPIRWLPPHTPHHGEHPPLESALLDTLVYVDDLTGASTSRCMCATHSGHILELNFWAARPPLLSYFTIHLPDLLPEGPATPLDRLPRLLRTHGNLALLRVPVGQENDYFLYDASPRFSMVIPLTDGSIGLLRCPGQDRLFVAVLHKTLARGHYAIDLLEFNHGSWTWSTRLMHAESPQECDFGIPTKSFALPASICWVDHVPCILICDLLDGDDQVLRFIRFPVLAPPKKKRIAGYDRDVAVGSDACIRYMEVWAHPVPGSDNGVTYTPQDWGAAIARWLEPHKKWQISHELKASQIAVDDSHSGLLPRVEAAIESPILSRLHAGHPALSLHDDDVVYIMAKVDHRDEQSWMLALDMRSKTLKGVAALNTGRSFGYIFFPSEIFKLLEKEEGGAARGSSVAA